MKQLVFILIPLFFSQCGNDKHTFIKPERTTITESVYTSVTIQPDSLYEVYSVVTGILSNVSVEEGSRVRMGQALFHVSNDNPRLTTENARLAMEMAQNNLNGKHPVLADLKNEVELAALKYRNDSLNYARQQQLWDKKVGTKMELDNRKLQFETAKQQWQIAQNRYRRTQEELTKQAAQAYNTYQSSLLQTKDFTIQSNANGMVYSVLKKEGELISPQQPLAVVGSATTFIAELLVDEVDIAKIALQQKVIIRLEAYKNEVFEAVVHKIYPQKNDRSQTFKIEALFTQAPPKLYPGLSGEANIVVSQKENCLTIPKAYLKGSDKVVTDSGELVVQTGLESLDRIEILSSLDTNTVIYLPAK